jgi:hypothetical protein
LHAFDRSAVRALVADSGLRVIAELSDPLPREHHAFFAATGPARARATAKWALRAAVWRIAPFRGERWFTMHYAVLTKRA